jgi:hypothetical protein
MKLNITTAGILLSLLGFLPFTATAQYFYSYKKLTLGVGTVYFLGDIDQTIGELRPAPIVGFGFPIREQVSTRFHFMYGSYRAADSLSSRNQSRNLHVKSMLIEGSAMIIWEPLNKRHNAFFEKTHISPYGIYGVSCFYMSPQAKYQGEWVDLQSLGTEGQYIPERYGKFPKPYKKYQFSIPIGGGISYYIKPTISINAEMLGHFTFTDYMDDVSSDRYPSNLLLKGYNSVAAALSYRGNASLTEFSIRGNPKDRDFYWTPSFSVTFHLAQRKAY